MGPLLREQQVLRARVQKALWTCSVQALHGGTEAHQQPGRPAIKPQWEEGVYTWDMLVIRPWKKGLEAKTDMFPSPDPLRTKT